MNIYQVMTPTYKIFDLLLKFYRLIIHHKKHITYVSLISLVQIALVLWYLNFRKPADSLNNIEKNLIEINTGQKELKNDIKSVKQQIIVMVAKDSTMDQQLRHYPATLPLAMADLTSVSSTYSERIDPITHEKRFHWGIDYQAPKDTPVYATATGIVEKAQENDDGYGNVVRLNHENGYESLYAHLNKIDVTMNQEVQRGDLIGTVGNLS